MLYSNYILADTLYIFSTQFPKYFKYIYYSRYYNENFSNNDFNKLS